MHKQSLINTISLIKSDLLHRCEYEHKKLSTFRVFVFFFNESVVCQILYRFQMFFYTNHLTWLAHILESLSSLIFTVKIDSRSKIGPGLFILHASYIYIGKNVTIGKNCILAHQNSIGPAFCLESNVETPSDIGPNIGDNVFLGVGSVIYGSITIGNNSKISINSAVDKSFPDNSLLVGVPARNLQLY